MSTKSGGSLSNVLTDNSEAHSAIRERRQKADKARDATRERRARLQIRVSPEMQRELKARAALNDTSVDAYVREALADHLKRAEAKDKRSKK